MSDETNPAFLFQSTDTSLLTSIVQGDIDPVRRAAGELASRGLDHKGDWVGFAKAENIYREFTK